MKAKLKTMAAVAMTAMLAMVLCACSGATQASSASTGSQASSSSASSSSASSSSAASASSSESSGQPNSNIASELPESTLVAYFSATGNTEQVAQYVADALGATLYRIEPAQPYTSEDLNYSDDSTRATTEQKDKSARPEIKGPLPDMDRYDTVILGYPIWWGEEPRIIDAFVEKADFAGKAVAPFCTSGSSAITSSVKDLETLAPSNVEWLEGHRFAAGASAADVSAWLTGIGLL